MSTTDTAADLLLNAMSERQLLKRIERYEQAHELADQLLRDLQNFMVRIKSPESEAAVQRGRDLINQFVELARNE